MVTSKLSMYYYYHLFMIVVMMLLLDVSSAVQLQFKKGSTLDHPHGVQGMSSKYMQTNKV